MHKFAVFAVALIVTSSRSATGSSTVADDPVPVRNWQAPACWAVPAQNDGNRSARVDNLEPDVSSLASAVYVNSSGQLGTVTSSARFKDDVGDLADPSPLLLALRPVSFVYKTDDTRTPQAGLIAEEVEAIAPHLVTRDEEGRLLSVRYDQLVPLLLAEAQRLERDNARLLKALERLTDRMAAVEQNLERPLPQKP